MSIESVLIAVAVVSMVVVVYHHLIYPFILEYFGSWALNTTTTLPRVPHDALPSVAIIVPAYNEAAVISEKMRNLRELDYPAGKLRVVIALDGCTDGTADIVRMTRNSLPNGELFEISESTVNIGKIAILNNELDRCTEDLIALSDASALVTRDALLRAAAHFVDPGIGVVCGTYRLNSPGSEGERAYWIYQTRIKSLEGALAAPMGAHGAFYVFRHAQWRSLEPDIINDDFFIPMRIVLSGQRAVYDREIVATEIERTTHRQEFARRVRIGAGNLQQLLWLPELMSPRRGWLAFLFLSGKALRTLIPIFLFFGLLSTVLLAMLGNHPYSRTLGLFALLAVISSLALRARVTGSPRVLAWLGYLIEGHFATGLGAFQYLGGRFGSNYVAWRHLKRPTAPLPASVILLKRVSDIAIGSLMLMILGAISIPIAVAIKLESPGPIFYRQLRIGASGSGSTRLISIYKFRTMRNNAEDATGPVWAANHDPRVTRVGQFLRRTRLDELPQCINVLLGDMSVIGPRPERPSLVNALENSIPFYLERTFGLKPGITGLAQVHQGYDAAIDDVRNKVMYDHAYALRLMSLSAWLKTDMLILWKTFFVMVRGQGQ